MLLVVLSPGREAACNAELQFGFICRCRLESEKKYPEWISKGMGIFYERTLTQEFVSDFGSCFYELCVSFLRRSNIEEVALLFPPVVVSRSLPPIWGFRNMFACVKHNSRRLFSNEGDFGLAAGAVAPLRPCVGDGAKVGEVSHFASQGEPHAYIEHGHEFEVFHTDDGASEF